MAAEMAPEDEVRQASDRFYAALGQMLNGDLGDLEGIWSHSSDSTAMHPAPPLARDLGWEQVKEGFGVFARLVHGGRISPRDRRIVTGSDMAFTTQIEEVQTIMDAENVFFTARSSTAYRRENGAWKVVLHHIDFAPELAEAVGRAMQKDETASSTVTNHAQAAGAHATAGAGNEARVSSITGGNGQ